MFALKRCLPWVLVGACCLQGEPVFPQLLNERILSRMAPVPKEFSFSLGLGGGYSSNPGLLSESGEAVTGDSTGDFRMGLADHRSSPRTDWSARYDGFYVRHVTNSQFDTFNHFLNFDGRFLVTPRARLSLLESYFYSRNPLQTGILTPDAQAVILTQQSHRWRNVVNATLDTSLSRSWTLQVGANSRIEHLELDPAVDSRWFAGHVGVQKQAARNNSLATTYTYSQYDFSTTGNETASTLDVSWSHEPPSGSGYVLSTGVSRISREGGSQQWMMAQATYHRPFLRSDFVAGYRRSLDSDAAFATVTLAQDAFVGVSPIVRRSGNLVLFGEYGTRGSTLGPSGTLELHYIGSAVIGSIELSPRIHFSGVARRRRQVGVAGAGETLTVSTVFLGFTFQVV